MNSESEVESIAEEYLANLERHIRSLKQSIQNIDNLYLVDSPSNIKELKLELIKINTRHELMNTHLKEVLQQVVEVELNLLDPEEENGE